MRFIRSLLPLIPLLASSAFAQVEVECDNADLTAYLLQLIDALYANGLTTFEALLADITSSTAGYNLLSHIYLTGDQTFTLLVPTDSAFQMAGVWAPFGKQSSDYLVDFFGLHTLEGHYGYNELPVSGMDVGRSQMRVTSKGNGTATGSGTGWQENVVMKRGDNGAVTIKTAQGDVMSWSGPADLSSMNLLDNLVILPIDHVLTSPPNISAALTMPTTTRSPNGLPLLEAAIKNVSTTGAHALADITWGGLTFFAPVDDAWVGDAWSQVDDKSLRAKLIGNHYTTNATFFSPAWVANGSEVTVMTGEKLLLSVENGTSYVSLGDQKAQILRSDIALENGVLHIIDKVLLVSDAEKSNPFVESLVTSPSQTSVVKIKTVPTASATPAPVPTSGELARLTSGSGTALMTIAVVMAVLVGL